MKDLIKNYRYEGTLNHGGRAFGLDYQVAREGEERIVSVHFFGCNRDGTPANDPDVPAYCWVWIVTDAKAPDQIGSTAMLCGDEIARGGLRYDASYSHVRINLALIGDHLQGLGCSVSVENILGDQFFEERGK